MCCVIPGVLGMSANIRVRSIVGRFLEHSRVYWFNNLGDTQIYVGSADLMERNLDRRVETLFPIHDPEIRDWIGRHFLTAYLGDTQRARLLTYDGKWRRAVAADVAQQHDCQQYFASVATME
jgi:polyphosphate kinase